MDENVERDNLIKNLQVDMISAYPFNQEQIEAYNLTLSEKYFSIPTEQGTEELYFAFTSIADPVMISRITDALQSITSEQKEQLLWSKIPKEPEITHKRTDIIIIALLFVSTALLIVMISFVRKYKKGLMKQIHTDQMTGYGNHVQLFEDYAALITDHNRYSYCVVNLKIENISYISEVHGYVERDNTLTHISHIIQSQLSEYEMFARISEGSFILVIQYLSQQQLTQRLDQLYLDIENTIKQESKDYVASLKSGIYFLAIHDKDLNLAINHAVQARKYAQNNNLSYAIYDEAIFKSINLVKELDQEVITGLENNEFIPYFQPKLNVESLEIVGFEALSRWQNKKRGLLFPGDFIPVLEKNGLLGEVDIALFRNVCQLMGQRVNDKKELLHISCNFSRYSFYRPDFCTTLKEIAQEQQVPTSYLEIEISDHISAENIPEIISKVNELKSYGFTVALDNFGGGYSSIMDLKNCSIDTLKLDKEMIKDIQNPKIHSIMGSIVEMCHDIGVEVACQGVETEEQLQLLKHVDCDYAQGYLFYQPMPYSELDKLI
ncbi:EAL domain-containing protein [Paenibacillus faecalis]|uniref:EAL domain-containing protein n=1 Tax=Paenibacillus faecalis TaxID=2079532 RepID=UPI00131A5641|nr:GGDEF domain-containing phosphodiesterase [Paenibacillus faecalis]